MKARKIKTAQKIAIALFSLGAGLSAPHAARADATYYHEFGGRADIHAVITNLLDYVLADDRIKAYFTNANIPVLNASLTTQVCMLEGGP